METFKYVYECPICEGNGQVEYGPVCFKPASECCGGCYKVSECSKCDGKGTLTASYTTDELQEIFDAIIGIRHHALTASNLVHQNLENDESN